MTKANKKRKQRKIPIGELPFHFGITMRIYPSSKQANLIKKNCDIARTIYNKINGINQEIYGLTYKAHHQDFYKVVAYLVSDLYIERKYAEFAVEHLKFPDKLIQKLHAKHYHEFVRKIKVPFMQYRLDDLQTRKQSLKQLANHYLYMQDPDLDSLNFATAKRNYNNAWNIFRKVHNAGTPKFHKKGYTGKYQTSCQNGLTMYDGSVRFTDKKHIILPKLGRIRVSGSNYRKVLDLPQDVRIGTTTIGYHGNGTYYVSMQLGSTQPFKKQPMATGSVVGIDMNLSNFLTDSNGNEIDNPRYFQKGQTKLKHLQHDASRKLRHAKGIIKAQKKYNKEHPDKPVHVKSLREFSNYQAARERVAKLHQHIANQRENFVNQISTIYINNHDVIVAEKLQGKNMLKNHALAKSISDVGWGLFFEKLKYKAELYGKIFIQIDPKFTTQTCSHCGTIMGRNGHKKIKLGEEEWICPECGTFHVRDWNAALNILHKGLVKLKQLREAVLEE